MFAVLGTVQGIDKIVNMKIVVFSDFHGSIDSLKRACEIVQTEKPDKTVICGDLFGCWGRQSEIVSLVESMDTIMYIIAGNNDYSTDLSLLKYGYDENAVMYHFGRTLFFTHGHRYNGWNVPPVLKQGDVLVYGHTHCSRLYQLDGLNVYNVGAMALPRDGHKAYLVLDERGATLRDVDGNVVMHKEYI